MDTQPDPIRESTASQITSDLQAFYTQATADLLLLQADRSRLQADLDAATQQLKAVKDSNVVLQSDFDAIKKTQATLTGQLTAIQKKYDNHMLIIHGTTTVPPGLTPSPNGTTVTNNVDRIIDASLNIWTLTVDSVVQINGANAAFTSGVITILYFGGSIYQENINHNWWVWSGTDWTAVAGDPRGAAPVITSSLTTAGVQSVAFSYQIVATNTPTSYSASGLPSGLSVNTGTGIISGTPTVVAVTNVTIGATNGTGSDSETLQITIASPTAKHVGVHGFDQLGINGGGMPSMSDAQQRLITSYTGGIDWRGIYADNFDQPFAGFWENGHAYVVGDIVSSNYNGNVSDFECIANHTSNAGNRCVDTRPGLNTQWARCNGVYLRMLQASEALVTAGTPAAKIAWGVLGLQDTVGVDTEFLDFVIRHRASTGLYRDASNRFIITGYNNAWSDATYMNYLVAGGCSVAYWPDQQYSGGGSNEEQAAAKALAAKTAGASGLYLFIASTSGAQAFDEVQWESLSSIYKTACAAQSIGFMPGIMPFYQGNQNNSLKNPAMFEPAVYGFGGGLTGWVRQLKWCIDNNSPSLQVTTGPDFQEETYIDKFGNDAAVLGTNANPLWSNTITISHSGYHRVMKHYVDWFKNGSEPTISTDSVVLCYKLHPRDVVNYVDLPGGDKTIVKASYLESDAIAWFGGTPENFLEQRFQRNGSGGTIGTFDIYHDTCEVWVALSATADVTLTLGSSSTTQTLGQGVHILTIVGAATDVTGSGYGSTPNRYRYTSAQYGSSPYNKPHVTIIRSAVTIFSQDGALPVTPYIVPGQFSYLCRQLL